MTIIKHKDFFAWLLIVMMIAASIRYGTAGDLRKCIYWACGAGLNIAITI
ncbi:MAG: hypothetical protein JEZ07_08765 [Phycisphaerae bacterium]|nr:hypothetical protein [Phycisphaerae bacterium]